MLLETGEAQKSIQQDGGDNKSISLAGKMQKWLPARFQRSVSNDPNGKKITTTGREAERLGKTPKRNLSILHLLKGYLGEGGLKGL